ncbi:MAG: 5-formyltetrahydrofolate cyclo-ligase [Anaerorhabdus sp.]
MKRKIRKETLKKRDNMSLEKREESDLIILKNLKNYTENYNVVAVYVSVKSEVDTCKFIEYLFKKGTTVVVPKVNGKQMNFIKIESFNELKPSIFNLLEPISDIPFNINDIDCFIVPLVAFCKEKYRIGYGGGYYDSTLKESSAKKIAIAYDCQEVSTFKKDNFDIDMDVIITPSRIYH